MLGLLGVKIPSQNYYDNGLEFIPLVEGYSESVGAQSKESDHLHLEATSVKAQRAYVSELPIDLTHVNKLMIDWKSVGAESNNNKSYLIVSTEKMGGLDVRTSYLAYQNAFSRQWSSLDVSNLSGSFYIRVHTTNYSSSVSLLGSVDVYEIRGVV